VYVFLSHCVRGYPSVCERPSLIVCLSLCSCVCVSFLGSLPNNPVNSWFRGWMEPPLPLSVTLTLRKGFLLHYAFIRLVLAPKVMVWRRCGKTKPTALFLNPVTTEKEQQKKEKLFRILRVCSGTLRTQPVHKWLDLKTSSLRFSHSSMRNMWFAKHEMESLSPDKINRRQSKTVAACAPCCLLLNKLGIPAEGIPDRC